MTEAVELTCRELVTLVTEYLEGALGPADRVRFERHLGECGGCLNHLRQMEETIRLTGKLTEDSIDPSAREQLLRSFRTWKQRTL